MRCNRGSNLIATSCLCWHNRRCVLVLQEVALLAQHRALRLPPIIIVPEMPTSDRWAAVAVDLPFEAVNEVLGVQLERSIISGVPP
jgi:hypothetical protein